jgi:hypothetical protein
MIHHRIVFYAELERREIIFSRQNKLLRKGVLVILFMLSIKLIIL